MKQNTVVYVIRIMSVWYRYICSVRAMSHTRSRVCGEPEGKTHFFFFSFPFRVYYKLEKKYIYIYVCTLIHIEVRTYFRIYNNVLCRTRTKIEFDSYKKRIFKDVFRVFCEKFGAFDLFRNSVLLSIMTFIYFFFFVPIHYV